MIIRAADRSQYPVKIELELTQWENFTALLAFLRYVKAMANAGHGFKIEADREEGADKSMMQKFGIKGEHPYVYVDGDGNDHIGKILVNGKELK